MANVTHDAFWHAVLAYCEAVRGSITSGLRTPERNAQVGGHPRSAHLVGLGADVVAQAPLSVGDRGAIARDLKLKLIAESDHDHLQPIDFDYAAVPKIWDST